jgi:hypothetical protein
MKIHTSFKNLITITNASMPRLDIHRLKLMEITFNKCKIQQNMQIHCLLNHRKNHFFHKFFFLKNWTWMHLHKINIWSQMLLQVDQRNYNKVIVVNHQIFNNHMFHFITFFVKVCGIKQCNDYTIWWTHLLFRWLLTIQVFLPSH